MGTAATRSTDRTHAPVVVVALALVDLAPLLATTVAAPMLGGVGWWLHDEGRRRLSPTSRDSPALRNP